MCDVTGVSRARAGESNNEKVTSTLPVRAGSNMHKTERKYVEWRTTSDAKRCCETSSELRSPPRHTQKATERNQADAPT